MGGGDRKFSESSKRRSDSYDSPAEKRIHQERIPLEDLIEQPESLAEAAVSALSWDLVVGMLPSYLKTRSKEEVIKLVKEELEGMSRRRIGSILDGDETPTSSSSESESEHSRHEEEENEYSEMSVTPRERRHSGSSFSRSPSQTSRRRTPGSRSPTSRSPSPRADTEDDEIEISE